MIEIPVKKKHIAGKGLYGYPRTHSGNSRKKVKKIGSNSAFQPYDKTKHVLVLGADMKKRFVHYA
jgi:hypothetical protein